MSESARSDDSSEPLLPGAGWGWCGVLAATLIPVAVGVPLDFQAKRPLYVTLFDPALAVAILWLLIVTVRAGRIRDLLVFAHRVAWPGLLLILAGVVSLLASWNGGANLLLAVKQGVQWGEYLVLTPLLFALLLAHPLWRPRVFWGLTVGTVAAILAVVNTPLAEVFRREIHPSLVGGLLGNRQSYALFMAMVCPLLSVWARSENPLSVWLLLPGILLPFLAIYPVLVGFGLLALLLGMAVAWLGAGRGGACLAILLTLWFAWSTEGEGSRARWLTRSMQVFRVVEDPSTGEERRVPSMRYYRWVANLNMVAHHPLTGVGWGRYQKVIGAYYGDLPRPSGRTDLPELFDVETSEPFSFGWFFVLMGELGVLGGVASFILLAELVARALGAGGRVPCLAGAGVVAVVLVLLIAGWWASPFVRGCGALLGFVLGLSAVRRPPDSLKEESVCGSS